MTRIFILILLGLACCTSDKKQNAEIGQGNSIPENDFIKFISLLPIIKLPYEINCEKCCDHPKMDYENPLIQKFRPEGSAIVGLVKKTDDKVILLVTYPADVLVPSIEVYDLEGKLTGKMDFMTGYCGGDFEYYGRQFFRITPDLSFSSIDTSYYLKMDTIDYHVIDTSKIEITRKDFSINEKGEVVEN